MKRVDDLVEYCKILNVGRGASLREIKKAYRSLARKYHPDLNPDNPETEAHFKRVNHAYEVLENHYKIKRVWKSWRKDPPERTKTPAPQSPPPKPAASFPPALKEIFYRWGGILRKSLEEYEKILFPLDVRTTVKVPAEKVAGGHTIKIQTISEKFEVNVPLASWNSFVLRMPEKGNQGLFNKKRGDLLVNIQVLPASQPPSGGKYEYKIQVPRESIEMNRVITLHTHEGPIKFFLPRNAMDGQTFTLKSKPRSNIFHRVTVHLA